MTSAPVNESKFYSPTYWPVWFLIGVWRLLILLPYRTQLWLGKVLGLFALRFDTKFRNFAAVNIRRCFPQLSQAEQRELLRKNFISMGIAVFETGLAWFASDKRLRKLGHIHGIDQLIETAKKGKGILLIGQHFLTLELTGRLMILEYPELGIVYRAHKKPLLNFLITKILNQRYHHVFERNNLKGIIKGLKSGLAIWYTPDIEGGNYDYAFVPFFGIPAATITAPIRIAQLTNSILMPCTYYRRDDGTGYDLMLEPPLENMPSENIEHDLLRINQYLERAISKKPEQYLWAYNRFLTRPEGEDPAFYKRLK